MVTSSCHWRKPLPVSPGSQRKGWADPEAERLKGGSAGRSLADSPEAGSALRGPLGGEWGRQRGGPGGGLAWPGPAGGAVCGAGPGWRWRRPNPTRVGGRRPAQLLLSSRGPAGRRRVGAARAGWRRPAAAAGILPCVSWGNSEARLGLPLGARGPRGGGAGSSPWGGGSRPRGCWGWGAREET